MNLCSLRLTVTSRFYQHYPICLCKTWALSRNCRPVMGLQRSLLKTPHPRPQNLPPDESIHVLTEYLFMSFVKLSSNLPVFQIFYFLQVCWLKLYIFWHSHNKLWSLLWHYIQLSGIIFPLCPNTLTSTLFSSISNLCSSLQNWIELNWTHDVPHLQKQVALHFGSI
jgi:hypothetical protein